MRADPSGTGDIRTDYRGDGVLRPVYDKAVSQPLSEKDGVKLASAIVYLPRPSGCSTAKILMSRRPGNRRGRDGDHTGLSVGSRALDVVDDQEFNGAFGGFELEAELLLDRGEHRGARRVGWGRTGGLVDELEPDVE